MTLYLINTPVLTNYGRWEFTGPITVEQARALMEQGFVSAIGHQASAQVLSDLLAINIPLNRITIAMQPGDQALVLRLLQRLPEGKILSHQELKHIPFEIGLLTRTA